MLDRLKSYLLFGNQFCGMEHATKNDSAIIYTTVLKKKRNEVVLEQLSSLTSIKAFKETHPKKQHAFLIINNEQVLTKVLDKESGDGLNLVNKAFPSINCAEFYYDIIHQNDISILSICRKTYVNTLIAEYRKAGVYIINFSLGNSIVSSIVNYAIDSSISSSNAVISIESNSIETINFNETVKDEEYDINGLKVPNTHLLSLCGALSSILNNLNSDISRERKNYLKGFFIQKRFFNQFLKVGLVSILGILLINFLFFNYYFKQVDSLKETSQINLTTKNKIIKLIEQVAKSQKIAADMLKSSSSKSSFYTDAIVQTVPASILLTEIDYQPILKLIKSGKTIELEDHIMVISGQSNNSHAYSNWISILESNALVNHIEVLEYSQSKTTSSVFSIKIKLN